MCNFCDNPECTLTKEQVLKRGAILESSISGVMRNLSDTDVGVGYTYCFKGVPAYYSLSALVPDKDEENPHSYERYSFDEDTGCDGDWLCCEITDPLKWRTEVEILAMLNSNQTSADTYDSDFSIEDIKAQSEQHFAEMGKLINKCDICPHEDTDMCKACTRDSELTPLGLEDAIKFFEEDNEYFERVLGENAKDLYEYRINKMVIDVLKEKLYQKS